MRLCTCLTCFALCWLPLPGRGQPTAPGPAPADTSRVALAQIVAQMEGGIYERILNLGYIPSATRYARTDTVEPHTEFTLLFFRFYGFAPTADGQACIGKVFMSERYLEKHYNRVYTSRAAYETDKDGKFMACKMYFDERSLEYRVNIYPDHLLNICRHNCAPVQGMHFNREGCTTTEEHWQSLRYVLSLADKHFDDFSKADKPGALDAFLTRSVPPNPLVNIDWTYLTDSECSADVDLFKPKGKAKRNTLLRINLHKQIKMFKLGSIDDPLRNVAKTLTLKYTKYALSDDLIEGPEYTGTFVAFDSLDNDRLTARGRYGEFVSRNPLYRSLIVANQPNDAFVSGLELTPRLLLSYLGDTTVLLTNKNQAPVPSLTRRQDVVLSARQQPFASTGRLSPTGNMLVPFPSAGPVSPPTMKGQLRITSAETRTDFWVYWGRDTTAFKPGSPVTLPGRVYLRDAVPTLVSLAGNQVWLKGKIVFLNHKTATPPPNDKGHWYYREAWPPPDSPQPGHRWLHVEYRPLTPQTAKK